MYMTNRKNAFKIIRRYKYGYYLLESKYGSRFKESPERLADSNYHEVQSMPEVFK